MNIKNKIAQLNSINFFKHSKFFFLGNMFSKALNILFMPVFTRILSTSDYGIIAIYQSLVNILVIVGTLSIEQALRHVYLRKREIFPEFSGTVLNFLFLFNIIFIAALWCFKENIIDIFQLKDGLYIFVIISLFFNIGRSLFSLYLVASQKSKQFMLFQLCFAVLVPAIAIPLILHADENKYLGRIIAQVLVVIVLGIYSYFSLLKISRLSFIIKHIKFALSYSLPLIPHFLATFILIQFDRIAINKIIDSSATGIYSFAYSIGFILQAIFNSTNAAWLPIFYKNLKEKHNNFLYTKMISYSKGIFIITSTLIIFGQEAIWILADSKFHSSIILLPPILLGIAFTFLFTLYISYLYYIEKTKYIAPITIFAGVLNIILNIVFIPKFGIIAAAYTTLVSYAILFLLSYFLVKKIYGSNNGFLNFYAIAKYLFYLMAIGGIFQVLYYRHIEYYYFLPFKVLIIILLLKLFIRKDDFTFLKQLMNKKSS